MSEDIHIAIVGAGLIGLSCADELVRRGARVTVIDQHAAPVRGTSFSNSGMIHPSQAKGWAGDLRATRDVYKLAIRSAALLAESISRLSLFDMAQRPEGSIKIYPNETARDQSVREYATFGVTFEMCCDARSFWQPALFFSDDRSGNSRTYGEALTIDLMERGVEFHLGKAVGEMNNSHGIWTVKLPNQIIRADHVIIAAGTATPALLSQLGIDVPITPAMGHALNFKTPDISLPRVPIMDAQSHSALSIFGNVLRISGGWQIDNPEDLRTRWREVAPEIINAVGPVQSTWSAPRPVTPHGRPYIAKAANALWVNAGHAHMGWTLCAGSGELMAEMILDGRDAPEFALPV